MAAVEELREFLCTELTDIDIFSKILKFGEARQKIFRCFSVSIFYFIFLY